VVTHGGTHVHGVSVPVDPVDPVGGHFGGQSQTTPGADVVPVVPVVPVGGHGLGSGHVDVVPVVPVEPFQSGCRHGSQIIIAAALVAASGHGPGTQPVAPVAPEDPVDQAGSTEPPQPGTHRTPRWPRCLPLCEPCRRPCSELRATVA